MPHLRLFQRFKLMSLTTLLLIAGLSACGPRTPGQIISDANQVLNNPQTSREGRAGMLSIRGEASLAQADDQNALKDFNEAIRLAPESPSSWYSRGKYWQAKKEYFQASADFEQAELLTKIGSVFPKLAELIMSGEKALANAEHQAALEAFDEAIALAPDLPTAWQARSAYWQVQGDSVKAEDDRKKATELKQALSQEAKVMLLVKRGESYLISQELDKAFKEFEEAVGLGPEFAFTWEARSQYWSARLNTEKAMMDRDKAREVLGLK